MRVRILEREGRTAEALQMHAAVDKVAPPNLEQLSPDLRAAVQKSRAMVEENNRRLEAFLAERLPSSDPTHPARFRESIDILLGKQRRFAHEPTQFFYPRLDQKYFFERELFPWLDAFDASVEEIRQEFLRVHEEDRGFSPYHRLRRAAAGEPVPGAEQLHPLERLPPVPARRAGRGQRLALPPDHGAAFAAPRPGMTDLLGICCVHTLALSRGRTD